MIDLLTTLFKLLIFPGFLFLMFLGLLFHWIDRKLTAKFEGRIGPPFFQPLADLIKLFTKEDILPVGTNETFATLLPLFSFGSVLTAGYHIFTAFLSGMSFNGDFIMVLFLLSLPSILFFLAGWTTSGVYSILGGNRSLLQYFSYEVLFLLALSGTMIATGSWSLASIQEAQSHALPYGLTQVFGAALSMAGLIGKLKRSPYDIPKAKSEMIVGPLTEYSGRKLGLWKLTDFIQATASIALLVFCYFSGLFGTHSTLSFLGFLALMVVVQFTLSIISAIFTRLRIDQLVNLNWRVFIPLSLLHNLIIIIL